jgi:hypothetical protein
MNDHFFNPGCKKSDVKISGFSCVALHLIHFLERQRKTEK